MNVAVRKSVLYLLLIVLVGTLAVSAQPQRNPPDPLGRLKRALSDSGAAALTTAQETALTSLITSFQTAMRALNDASASGIRTLESQYEDAIAAGQTSSAQALATQIANARNSTSTQALTLETNFLLQARAVLTADQIAAMQKKMGTGGFVGQLRSLAGGGGRGPGGPGGPPHMMAPPDISGS